MKPKLRRQLQRGKQKILQRLAPLIGGTEPRRPGAPEFQGPQPTHELAGRAAAVGCGGLGTIHRMVRRIGLPQLLNSRLAILKRARPYQDSDHVLNIAYNLLCGGPLPQRTDAHPTIRSRSRITGPDTCARSPNPPRTRGCALAYRLFKD